jgi:transposase
VTKVAGRKSRPAGLMRTRLAKSVSDAGWSLLLGCIQKKAVQYGRTFAKVGRFEPTSQVCSACGVKDGAKPLGQEHSRPEAQGEAKRLWNRRQTTAYGGCWC